MDYIPFAKRSWEDDSDPRNCFHTQCCRDYTGPSRLHGECIKRQRKPISISVYKHCFLEEPRAMNPAVACLEDIKAACISSTSHPPPLLLSLPCRASPFEPLPRSLADTSCMSPSCKRGVTRLTSIVLVDERAYRAMDRWASDDKDPGYRDGHALRCPASHRRYYQLMFRAITRGLDFACAITDSTLRYLFLFSTKLRKKRREKGGKILLMRAHFLKLPFFVHPLPNFITLL